MRLIDADAIEYTHAIARCIEDGHNWNELCVTKDDIDDMPTVEAEPVRHGRWLDGHRTGYALSIYWYIYCSECLCERDDDCHDKDTPYCPHCGARMEVEDETD